MKAKQINITLSSFLIISILSFSVDAQTYSDHFGTGNNVGVTATSSPTQNGDSIETTLSGTGYYSDPAGHHRFMAQVGFGATQNDIANLQQMGIENWISWQVNLPYTTYTNKYYEIRDSAITYINSQNLGVPTSNAKGKIYMSMAFWDKALKDEDIMRQKAAFALSQIFVVSLGAAQHLTGNEFAYYYDLLYQESFGNFRNILYNISLNSIVGYYLNHFRNKKEDPITGTKPDENFARELMQLFSIGLVELNNDGTPKLDVNGSTIPTYDIVDVQELAKVFTGLYSNLTKSGNYTGFQNGNYDWYFDFATQMVMYEENGIPIYHDLSEKYVLGDTIPASQYGLQDIDDAIDIIFNHPNVGPFISYRLIQQLVKSNPTPEYINRVAAAFNNNGNGVRGDMAAVFKAILLDTEARDCEWINHPKTGKLLQPMERYLNLFKAFDITTSSGNFWFIDNHGNSGESRYINQGFLSSPTVFNFFSPFYAEGEHVAANNMVSPEFEIFNSVSSLHILNRMNDVIKRMALTQGTPSYVNLWPSSYYQYHYTPIYNYTGAGIRTYSTPVGIITVNNEDVPYLDYFEEVNECLLGNYSAIIDHIDLALCRGQLNPEIKTHILNHVNQAVNEGSTYPSSNPCGNIESNDLQYTSGANKNSIVKDIIYYIMLSPSYNILK